MTEDNRVRAAVKELTEPVIEHIRQTDDDGRYLRTHTVEHAPLLTQLEEAITSAIGSGGGGGSATGNVLNGEALMRAMMVRSELGDWCRLVGVRPSRDNIASLIAWANVFTFTGRDEGYYLGKLHGWAQMIRNLIDPPKRRELTKPCPVCKATSYVNGDGDTMPNPLVFEYRETDLTGTVRAVCRNADCGIEWVGPEAVIELDEELAELWDTPTEESVCI